MKKKVILSVSIIVLSLILILGGNALRNNLMNSNSNSNRVSKKVTAVKETKKNQAKGTPVKSTSKTEAKTSSDEKAADNKQSNDKSKGNAISNKENSTNQISSSAANNKSASSNNEVTPSPSPKTSEEPNLTVVDSISNRTILSTYVDINEKTVGDMTLNALMSKGISVETTGSGYSLYISAIAGIREKEHGKNSGWIYFVNGNSPQVGCGSYKLKQGDKVTWKYSSN